MVWQQQRQKRVVTMMIILVTLCLAFLDSGMSSRCPLLLSTDAVDDIAKGECAGVHDLVSPLLPARHADVAGLPLNQVIVAYLGPSKDHREAPDHSHGHPLHCGGGPQLLGAQRIAGGQVPGGESKVTSTEISAKLYLAT